MCVVLVNECLAIFGNELLPFTSNMAYQVISLAGTIIISGINCWYNQDVTKVALIAGKIFDALDDKKITEEEIEQILAEADKVETSPETENTSFLIGFANGLLKTLKNKVKK